MYQVPESVKRVLSAVAVYDVQTGMLHVQKDQYMPEFAGECVPYEVFYEYYRNTFIAEGGADQALAQLTPEGLLSVANSGDDPVVFSVRLLEPDGTICWVEISLECVGPGEVLIASRMLHGMRRDAAVVRAVGPRYDFVARISVATGSFAMFVREGDAGHLPPLNGEDYDESVIIFNARRIVPEEAERLSVAMRLERVLEALEANDEYCLYCTMLEDGERRRKRLRYCWVDGSHEEVLVSRTDITDIVTAQGLRAEEESLGAAYLDNLPIACCVLKAIYGEDGSPLDARYVYSNRAHARLNGAAHGEIVGHRKEEWLMGDDDSLFSLLFDTAETGELHVTERYSAQLDKTLVINTFQPEPGFCGCTVLDVTEQRRLERDLASSRQKLDFILGQTMDVVFQYDPLTGKVDMFTEGSRIEGFPEAFRGSSELIDLGVIASDQADVLDAITRPIREGAMKSSGELQMCLPAGSAPRWYRVALYAHLDDVAHRRTILGYLTDIEDFVKRRLVLEREAKLDPLTGVLNARAGREAASRRMLKLDGSRTGVLVICDIDDFKDVNDQHGHHVGDLVLQLFSQVLVSVFRTEDTVYRLGGDEFAVYIEMSRDGRHAAECVLERLFAAVSEREVEGTSITISAGAYASDCETSFDEFYRRADRALYRSKRSGKSRWSLDMD